MNFDHEQLRRAVRARRDREGLTQKDVCAETGVSRSTLCRFLRGEGAVDIETAAALAEFAGVTLSTLSAESRAVVVECGDTLGAIDERLRHDPKLRPADAEGLMTIMRTAYRRAVEK